MLGEVAERNVRGRQAHEIRNEIFELCRKSEGLRDVSDRLLEAIAENLKARERSDNGMRRRKTDMEEGGNQCRRPTTSGPNLRGTI